MKKVILGKSLGIVLGISIFLIGCSKPNDPLPVPPPVDTRTIPGPPTIGTVTAMDTSAKVAFTAPSSDGGSPITGYTVVATPGDSITYMGIIVRPISGSVSVTSTTSPIMVYGLTNGIPYKFVVKATNAKGTSVSDSSSAVIPIIANAIPLVSFKWYLIKRDYVNNSILTDRPIKSCDSIADHIFFANFRWTIDIHTNNPCFVGVSRDEWLARTAPWKMDRQNNFIMGADTGTIAFIGKNMELTLSLPAYDLTTGLRVKNVTAKDTYGSRPK